MDKLCEKCNIIKKEELFYKKRGKFTKQCKDCRNKFMREYYRENKEKHIKLVYDGKKKRIKILDEFLSAIKSKPCFDCGGTFHPFVMDFDHRDSNIKKQIISKLSACGYSLKTLQEEIEKCDLVCANCHRMRTLHRTPSNKRRRYKIETD